MMLSGNTLEKRGDVILLNGRDISDLFASIPNTITAKLTKNDSMIINGLEVMLVLDETVGQKTPQALLHPESPKKKQKGTDLLSDLIDALTQRHDVESTIIGRQSPDSEPPGLEQIEDV